jgi:carboxypeptidase C (cathepsin A)
VQYTPFIHPCNLNNTTSCYAHISLLVAELLLFQNNTPHHFINSTAPVLNPYSFNSNTHMLYIDQPAGAGISYDSADALEQINSTKLAVAYVYELLQTFLQPSNSKG